ncbi:potassium-transporting ATPase subunit F [Vagococcus penaei]|uniref:Potassium-transporting ATPase subunit F n=1 Tax=Vagococcus penaei TaxID=633807 RepID=A0A1Q2D8M0_9ENTE|nr:potassium-transporting ATPase subunit F [Vagococcus penaei]RSU05307.1 potassium-transporting ATPase subunit F [Vagococcus penaei]
MESMFILLALIILLIFGYLLYALIFPEKI